MNDYPNAGILVDPAWLAAHLEDPQVRIVDCDVPAAWERVHIPGAVTAREHYYKGPESSLFIMGPEQFASTMEEMGIGDDTLVVGYDNLGARYSSRLWWCLNYYGHDRVKILNGGFPRWLAEGRALTTAAAAPRAVHFTPKANPALYATAEDVKAAIGRSDAMIVDARSDGEWQGVESRSNRRTGRIPGSVHFEWLVNTNSDDIHMLKPAAELKQMYEAAGVTRDKEIITVCQGGIRAAQSAATLRLLGYENVRVYDGSFAEWGNRDDTPLEK